MINEFELTPTADVRNKIQGKASVGSRGGRERRRRRRRRRIEWRRWTSRSKKIITNKERKKKEKKKVNEIQGDRHLNLNQERKDLLRTTTLTNNRQTVDVN